MGQTITDVMVRVEDVHKSYGGGAAVHALRGVSFEVPRGELVALKGRSGSGKTTLLNIVGGLDTPDRGRVDVDGRDLAGLDEEGLLALRRDRVGFVFQSFGSSPSSARPRTSASRCGCAARTPASARSASSCCCPSSASPTTPPSGPASCPAASSSGSPSPVPSPTTPPCSSPTSPPASSTPRPGTP
ncbi:hypothetical protein GCM10022285_12190 [Streptomyces tunisiensis]|uniref:ABC transporter domain-containing protein n=1 Tax=Streptomyces tunisiensis TaxID=948699 RepID=A0ABP7XWM3_9ACTN